MEPRWITLFVDQPAAAFARGTEFWASVTGSKSSPRRGSRDEFATLLPSSGDPFLRVQATADNSTRIHVDIHVDAVADAVQEAQSLGAAVVQDLGHVLMRSPAGQSFCLVDHHGEQETPAPIGDPPSALNQVSIDVPGADFDAEVDFWSGLFGWDRRTVSMPEFQRLVEPPGLPVRLLFQRLGDDSAATSAYAHLDIAAGEGRQHVAAWHESLGAKRVATFEHWIVMSDPIGLEYCLTSRDPRTTRT